MATGLIASLGQSQTTTFNGSKAKWLEAIKEGEEAEFERMKINSQPGFVSLTFTINFALRKREVHAWHPEFQKKMFEGLAGTKKIPNFASLCEKNASGLKNQRFFNDLEEVGAGSL